ncbi:ABC transporter ATP-binding protein [Bartonella apihabitans]|uniref:ABC transporter ATP-binding protein n=1 Tax=Bartonella apihabitans TaxID=2750929 RepID=UPI003998BB9C
MPEGTEQYQSSAITLPPAVKLDDVSVVFNNFTAVKKADLEVPAGQFLAIVGPTGCGKSTLLNVAAGLLPPAHGTCKIFGYPLSGINHEAGYLFQSDSLMPWKTAIDNIAIGLEIRGVKRQDALNQSREWLARVGLQAFGNRYPHQLSGGQRKRIGLAQVLILNPKLILMDEPFGPLDAQTRVLMGDLLLKLWSRDRKAVMFVTHDLEEAITLADRVIIISAGPASHVKGDYLINLPRPRNLQEIRLTTEFAEIHRTLWNDLKEEVLKAYEQGDKS